MTQARTLNRPWRRYWARFLDSIIAVLVTGFVVGAFAPEFVAGPRTTGWGVKLIGLFAWTFVEALLIAHFGTTPGKAFFRIRVAKATGERLPFGAALGRSLRVWALGTAFGLPLVSLLAAAHGAWRLNKTGATPWDVRAGSIVAHQSIGIWRWAGLAVVVGLFLLAGYLGTYV